MTHKTIQGLRKNGAQKTADRIRKNRVTNKYYENIETEKWREVEEK